MAANKQAVLLVLAVLLCTAGTTLAQERESYRVKPGSSIAEVVSFNKIFYFPQYTPGTVVFKNGTAANAPLNYNQLSGECSFIDGKGDTMALAEENTIRYIAVNTDTLYYDKFYLVRVAGNEEIILAKKVLFTGFNQQMGAYGVSTATNAVGRLSALNEMGRYNLKVTDEILLTKNTAYYLANKKGTFVKAEKKSIIKLFPAHEKDINQYLSANAVNFNREEDLKKLALFVAGLGQ